MLDSPPGGVTRVPISPVNGFKFGFVLQLLLKLQYANLMRVLQELR
jgi:hypothetical protein